MKTVEEAAKEQLKMTLNVPRTFRDGVAFAQRFIPVEEDLPEFTGVMDVDFDLGLGFETIELRPIKPPVDKVSDFVIAKDLSGEWHKAQALALEDLADCLVLWIDNSGLILKDIVEWRPIELK